MEILLGDVYLYAVLGPDGSAVWWLRCGILPPLLKCDNTSILSHIRYLHHSPATGPASTYPLPRGRGSRWLSFRAAVDGSWFVQVLYWRVLSVIL